MNKVEKLLNELCPNGVEFKELGVVYEKAPKSKIGVGKIDSLNKGNIICFTSGTKDYLVNDFLVDGEYIFVNDGGVADFKYYNGKAYYTDHVFTFGIKNENINVKFVYYYLKMSQDLVNEKMFQGSGLKNLQKKSFEKFQIPVPPIEIQKEIVRILDNFTQLEAELEAELEARKKQYEYYRDDLLSFGDLHDGKAGDEVEWKTIKELYDFKNGLNKEKKFFGKGTPIINFTDVFKYKSLISSNIKGKVEVTIKEKLLYEAKINDIFFTRTSETREEIGMASALLEEIDECVFSGFVLRARPKTKLLDAKYFSYYLSTYKARKEIIKFSTFTTRALTSGPRLSKIKVPIPSIQKQKEIVAILDKFDALVNDISVGLPAELQARRQQYEYYRNKLLTFKKLEK